MATDQENGELKPTTGCSPHEASAPARGAEPWAAGESPSSTRPELTDTLVRKSKLVKCDSFCRTSALMKYSLFSVSKHRFVVFEKFPFFFQFPRDSI